MILVMVQDILLIWSSQVTEDEPKYPKKVTDAQNG